MMSNAVKSFDVLTISLNILRNNFDSPTNIIIIIFSDL